MIQLKEFRYSQYKDTILDIYRKEHWNAYMKDEAKLERAFDQSLYLLGAFSEDKLVGFARCVGDGEHILLVQDLIVDPEYQKQGIGTSLFQKIWNKYSDVRMFQVITDMHDPVDNHFYQSFGMKKLEEGEMVSYFR